MSQEQRKKGEERQIESQKGGRRINRNKERKEKRDR
jgi:hypothetical protein